MPKRDIEKHVAGAKWAVGRGVIINVVFAEQLIDVSLVDRLILTPRNRQARLAVDE